MAKAVKTPKTNAMRELESAGISYVLHTYEDDGDESVGLGVAISEQLGEEPGQGFKTLVCVTPSNDYVVCCIPVPGGHIYLNDIIIVIAALSLDPLGAFLVGGVGAFLGDFFFYPLPMFVSLATHGIRSVVMSLIVGRYGRDNFPVVLGATVLGALIAIAGYTLGKVYVYSTWEYAMLKLPFEILQAFIGSAIGLFLWKNRKWGQMIRRFLGY